MKIKLRLLPGAVSFALAAALLPTVRAQSADTGTNNQTTSGTNSQTSTAGTGSQAGGPAQVVQMAPYEVTGYRASLASAEEIKYSSQEIVDSIVASDINQLPDVNVSYALSRIPGIQVAHTTPLPASAATGP